MRRRPTQGNASYTRSSNHRSISFCQSPQDVSAPKLDSCQSQKHASVNRKAHFPSVSSQPQSTLSISLRQSQKHAFHQFQSMLSVNLKASFCQSQSMLFEEAFSVHEENGKAKCVTSSSSLGGRCKKWRAAASSLHSRRWLGSVRPAVNQPLALAGP